MSYDDEGWQDGVTFNEYNAKPRTRTTRRKPIVSTTRRDQLEAQAARVLDQLNKLQERPEEPEFVDPNEPQVIWFRRNFQSGTTKYTYAAVKACGYWYVSGRAESMQRRTWDQLMDWLFSSYDHGVTEFKPEVWIATEWVKA